MNFEIQQKTLLELIGSPSRRVPDSMAIMAPGRDPLSYSSLYKHIQHVIQHLHQICMGPSDRIAIVLPNGPEMATAFLSVACCATAAPLNPAYSAHEFEFYLIDLKAKALIVQKGLESPALAVAEKLGIPIIELSPVFEAEAGIFSLSGNHIPCPTNSESAKPDDIALILHTSGTTSRPKIVPLTQENICLSSYNIAQTLSLDSDDRCLNVMPLYHIHGLVGALCSSLSAGASVVCTQGFSDQLFNDCLSEFKPTWYTAVPTIHQAVIEYFKDSNKISKNNSLRFIRSSSASLPPKVFLDLEDVFHVPVIEAYGMTEAAHQIASNPLPPGTRKPGSVGIASGPDVSIMDEDGHFLNRGKIGEIVIRGANVTRGYENNPTENAKAYEGGWFRTGDQGCLDDEGYLFINGRLKEIINRGGEKVSPREIDEALLDHPGISQAVAFALSHSTLGEDIAAAVVLQDKVLTVPQIREYLFGRLADYKIPSQILIVEEIPKGATGKIQRIGLAKKFKKQFMQEYIAPGNSVETVIANIYTEILGIKEIGISDNFFKMGGDSLRATQAISRIRSAFQVNLPIVMVFRKPTVKELADEITASKAATDNTLISDILSELNSISDEEAQRLLAAEIDQK